jgi:hypothetical protein
MRTCYITNHICSLGTIYGYPAVKSDGHMKMNLSLIMVIIMNQ